MNRPIQSIVILGGGSAGWLTAGRIAAQYQHPGGREVEVTLIESPDAPSVGVGEGTWPTMRSTLIALGISETEFLRCCNATFKQGAKFARWKDGSAEDFYYHPLTLPQGFGKGNLIPFWQKCLAQTGTSFSSAMCFQEALCERGLAPKTIRTPEYQSVANYAYHLDAGKFAQLLQRHCTEKLGVKHRREHITEVISAADGDIEALKTRTGEAIQGDLFVDCSGFCSRLLGEHYQIPFVDYSDTLFIDTALAVQMPYPDDQTAIASHTISTAQSAGWIWDIGLQHRRGIGHVYSSRHTNESTAEKELRAYLGPEGRKLEIKKIPIHSGHRQLFWHRNCVAIGLSAGFLEPLEASALVLVELSAAMLAEQLPPSRELMPIIARRFNATFQYRWERIVDFLKLHYCISKRSDSQFWIDNRDPEGIPESLQELLQLWRHRPPTDQDFTSNNEVFPAASYQYVLYGMGFESEQIPNPERDLSFGERQHLQNQKLIEKALAQLPPNRELLEKIQTFGLQTI